MSSAVEELLTNPDNRNKTNAAVWVTESIVEPDEAQKCEQYKQRQEMLPDHTSHPKYGEVLGNVAAHIFQPSELDSIGEHSRCMFLNRRNIVSQRVVGNYLRMIPERPITWPLHISYLGRYCGG